MVTAELLTVWIASDGRKFFSEKEANAYEQEKNKENKTWLEKLQLNLKQKK